MKINLRSIIIVVVVLLLATNLFVGIYHIRNYENNPYAKKDTILYQINIKRYEIRKNIDNTNKEINKNTYIYEKIRDSIANASSNDNYLFFSDYTEKYNKDRFDKDSHIR